MINLLTPEEQKVAAEEGLLIIPEQQKKDETKDYHKELAIINNNIHEMCKKLEAINKNVFELNRNIRNLADHMRRKG